MIYDHKLFYVKTGKTRLKWNSSLPGYCGMSKGQKITDRPGVTNAFKASSALVWKFKAYAVKILVFIFFLKYQFHPLGNTALKANEMEFKV